MSEKYFLTKEGAEKMRTELEDMKTRQRDELAKRLRFAIQQGDLSENADYHKAKEDQAFLEGKIREYEETLAGAKIIEEKSGGVIDVGSHITIQEEGYPEETYFMVGAREANPREGRISNESPIGSALLGHKVGDTVTVTTPGGQMKIKILKVN
ncbi:MAG TPA: transcription elongation factor GreA [Anaerolineales bacterium]|nr:transcription elongation factor GreA [Anaerolineales bacterium]